MRAIFLLVAAVALSGAAHAREAVLKDCRGHVSVRQAATKKWVRAKPGQTLGRNDQVKTGAKGVVQLSFANGATLLVKEGSWFSLKRDKRGGLVSFRAGEFLIGLKRKLEGRDRFRVRTPVAVGAVRGTVFWGKHDATNTTTFACFTGEIDVWGAGQNVTLAPGQTTSVKGNAPPEPAAPHQIPAEYAATFAIDGDMLGIDEQLRTESAP